MYITAIFFITAIFNVHVNFMVLTYFDLIYFFTNNSAIITDLFPFLRFTSNLY